MTLCTFCGIEIPVATGMMYVKNDGKIFHFCRKKCEKSQLKMGRKSRDMKWTAKKE